MAMPDLQRYSWNLYLINNVEDVVVSLGLKEFDSEFPYVLLQCDAQVTFVENPQLKIIRF